MIVTKTIKLQTQGFNDMVNITPRVLSLLEDSPVADGLICVFCPGSTGSVTTIEYESGVLHDLKKALERIAPSDIPYRHDERW